jgi:membrane-associated protease RseP (regulator of RpoE activity)
MTLAFICALVLTVVVHELGHALAAKKLGVRIVSISLFGLGPLLISWPSKFFNGARMGFGPLPYGAYVSLNETDMKRLKTEGQDDISFAGPHMNFVAGTLVGCLYMLCYGTTKVALIATCISAALTLRPVKLIALYAVLPFVALYVIGDLLRFESMSKSVNEGFFAVAEAKKFFDMNDFVRKFLLSLTLLNAGLGVLNMLPVYPLDGGHVAKRYAEKVLNKEKFPYRFLFVYLPTVLVILLLLPIVGDVRKLFSFFF